MNYIKIYDALIHRAKNRNLINEYLEKHHAIPRCIGGTDEAENLVKLTPEEHYVAHQLLIKIYPNNSKLIFAAAMMIPNRSSNKMYGWLKRKHSKAISQNQAGSGNSQFETFWIFSNTEKRSIKISTSEKIPEGWEKGRKINFSNQSTYCLYCNSKFDQPDAKKFTKFCSLKCKMYYKAPHFKLIDDNLENIIEDFKITGSINLTLQKLGLTNRQGNTYLSKILKSKGFNILKRRNS